MLSIDQQEALTSFSEFLLDKERTAFALMGSPGCGKTYLTKELVRTARKIEKFLGAFIDKDLGLSFHFTASTNKAAQVMQENLAELNVETTTIHKLLGLTVYNNYTSGVTKLKTTANTKTITNSIIFVDEASMLEGSLLELIAKYTYKCKLIFIGDKNQALPLFDKYSAAFDVPTKKELTTRHRQQKGSGIIDMSAVLCDTIATGKFPKDLTNADIIQCTGDEFQAEVDATFKANHTDPNNAKILCWANNTVQIYNEYVRKLYTQEESFIEGESVILNSALVVENNRMLPTDSVHTIKKAGFMSMARDTFKYDVEGKYYYLDEGHSVFVANDFNDVTRALKEAKRNKDWSTFFGIKEGIADLRAPFACTIHKAQGSSYNKVFIDLEDLGRCNQWNDVARLLHVAITRTRGKVFLYGELPEKYRK
jgi:hypothetical protein